MKREGLKVSTAYTWKESESLLCCKFDNQGQYIFYGGHRGVLSVRNLKNGSHMLIT